MENISRSMVIFLEKQNKSKPHVKGKIMDSGKNNYFSQL